MADSGTVEAVSARPRGALAVIDIGSNSIRLVVFDGLKRVSTPLFNEKVICRLGRELHLTGRLPEQAMDMAYTNLVRFVRMAEGLELEEISLLATAAARNAENGPEFIAELERRCGRPVRLLSGDEEARLSALGVVSGVPDATGLMGDLGGGSLELVSLNGGELGPSATLDLGPLRFLDLARENRKAVRAIIDEALDSVGWLPATAGRTFYAVGGAWRNLARLHMDQSRYPLRMIQGFSVALRNAEEMARLVSRLGEQSVQGITGISRRRLETLPYCALLLLRLLRVCRPEKVVFSAFGLREGFLFDRLPQDEREKDPLLFGAAEFARREGGFALLGAEIHRWIAPLFPEETARETRLRAAACQLSNIAWREHPDYRAPIALARVLHHPFSGVEHPGRAFLALAVHTRYAGSGDWPEEAQLLSLLSDDDIRKARAVGHALRLAQTLSAGRTAMLQRTSLDFNGDRLRLTLPEDGSIPIGEAVERRFKALVTALGATGGEIGGAPCEPGAGK